jgi:two-component system sensor histidine kinase BaeS
MRSTIHEMRNQLTVAVGNIEAFLDGKLAPTPQRLTAVLGALHALDSLMSELPSSAGARPPAPKLEPADMCALIARESVALEATAQAAGVRLYVDQCALTHSECSVFMCDPVQVSQVVTNVLLNAIRHTGRGGLVTLCCHREPGVLALAISNTGPGVPVAEREATFARGVRGSTVRSVPGSGVGLAVVQGIVDAHGGTVSVTDNIPGGALFTIRLPGRVELVHASATPVN